MNIVIVHYFAPNVNPYVKNAARKDKKMHDFTDFIRCISKKHKKPCEEHPLKQDKKKTGQPEDCPE
ncbi:MAG: hypothetical protein J5845_03335 [Lachnospiraceae bacterium]|nr:hypothetical protein [Lachnospiraceae bacterium]